MALTLRAVLEGAKNELAHCLAPFINQILIFHEPRQEGQALDSSFNGAHGYRFPGLL